MPRINRKVRAQRQNRVTRAQILELLIGPYGDTVFPSVETKLSLWSEIEKQVSPEFAERWYVAQSHPRPFAQIARQYARDVISGQIPACRWVRLACQRHLRDLDQAAGGDWEYCFDVSKAERVCRFIELLPHVKGRWAANAELIVLQPWQIFILCAIFGWVKVADGQRRFSIAYIEVSRKNGKSALAAGVGLYMFACDHEFGSEVYSGATTEDQAHEVFRPARQMMARMPELARILGLRTPPAAKKLEMPENGSRFEPVVGNPGDGASPHCGIVDEYHEHASDALVDTFRTGMGARSQPLLFIITTAGDNAQGPCKLLQGDVAKILEGVDRSEVFGIIYTVDDPKKWYEEVQVRMANPNAGFSVSMEFLMGEVQAALLTPRKQGVVQTKHCCIWVGALLAYFDKAKWETLGNPALLMSVFAGCPAVTAIDLATRQDFTFRVTGFKRVRDGKDHYYLFTKAYLPKAQIEKPENGHYRDWEAKGYIAAHDGAVVDFEAIAQDTIAEIQKAKSREFAFDPWGGDYFAQVIEKNTRAEIVKIPQQPGYLSLPMKELAALTEEGRVHHDGNPVLAWMIGNVVAKEDVNENVLPRKEARRGENKIDGAVACIMVISRLMVVPAKKSVYATRGVLTLPPINGPGMGAYA